MLEGLVVQFRQGLTGLELVVGHGNSLVDYITTYLHNNDAEAILPGPSQADRIVLGMAGLDRGSRMRISSYIAIVSLIFWAVAGQAEPPRTALVDRSGAGGGYLAEGVVEAGRQTVLAAQVPGRITSLYVKAGDRVSAGQRLARIDARAAGKAAEASAAQVKAAEARLFAAQKEYERAELLARKHYISQAALERAHAQFQATQAGVDAQLAAAVVAEVGTSLHNVTAPYAGRIASVDVSLGDMAMPGRPLISLFDPAALRVTVNVPQAEVADLRFDGAEKIEIPTLPEAARWIKPRTVTLLPTADGASHTAQLRLELPPTPAGVMPGLFARAWMSDGGSSRRICAVWL